MATKGVTMPNGTSLLDEIDSAVSVTAEAARRKTWFDHLPADAQQTLSAARDKFRSGGYEITRNALAKVLVGHATKHGWKVCDVRRMVEWLAQS
jgi:hypothetical protein